MKINLGQETRKFISELLEKVAVDFKETSDEFDVKETDISGGLIRMIVAKENIDWDKDKRNVHVCYALINMIEEVTHEIGIKERYNIIIQPIMRYGIREKRNFIRLEVQMNEI